MVIPAAVIELHKADTALDESAGQEAVVGEGRLSGLGAVLLQHLAGLLLQIHELRHAALHAVGHFERLNPGVDLGVAQGIELELIQLVNPVEEPPSHLVVHSLWIGDIKDRLSLRSKLDALMVAGQEAATPISGEERLILPEARAQDHKCGQLVVLAAQAVGEPGSHGRPPGLRGSRLHHGHPGIMIDRFGVKGSNQGDVVGHTSDVRE